jgi:hypothetical protein
MEYGGLTRLEYAYYDDVVDYGLPNPVTLEWFGGVALRSGAGWQRISSTVYGHAFTNDFAEGVYTRAVEFGFTTDNGSVETRLEGSKNRHCVVRGTGQDGQQWLIASPNAPMTMAMTVVRTVGTVTTWKGRLFSKR